MLDLMCAMNTNAATRSRRKNPQFIDDLVAQPAFLHAFLAALKQLQAVFPSRSPTPLQLLLFRDNVSRAIGIRVGSQNHLLLITEGRLCTVLAHRLLCFQGQHRPSVRHAFKLSKRILSQRHIFEDSSMACVSTIAADYGMGVRSVAFHPTEPIAAIAPFPVSFSIGDKTDRTAILLRLSSKEQHDSSATCVANLEGHASFIGFVAFHPTAPLLATGSADGTAKLWRLSSDKSSATCVATLKGHSNFVGVVAFHPTALLLATGSDDNTAKLWRLPPGNSLATCVATLAGHKGSIWSVAFHPTAPILATGSSDNTAKLWRLPPDNSSATCIATLVGHSGFVRSIAFHPTAPLLATGSSDKTAKLWRLSSDNSSATCVATLAGHSHFVDSVAFHPIAPLLTTGSWDCSLKFWG